MLGVIRLFLEGRLALLGTGVFGVLRAVLGVLAFCCAGVFKGVFWDDFALDGVLAAGFPSANTIHTQAVSQKGFQVSCSPTGCTCLMANRSALACKGTSGLVRKVCIWA